MIKVWEVATGKPVATFQSRALRMALSPDGKVIALSGLSTSVTLLEASTGKEIATLNGHKYHITEAVFSPDSKTLATGSADNTVKLWDVTTPKLLATLEGHALNVMALAFSADSKLLASGSLDTTVRLWDVRAAADRGK
jgi:WD40 repeat protein